MSRLSLYDAPVAVQATSSSNQAVLATTVGTGAVSAVASGGGGRVMMAAMNQFQLMLATLVMGLEIPIEVAYVLNNVGIATFDFDFLPKIQGTVIPPINDAEIDFLDSIEV